MEGDGLEAGSEPSVTTADAANSDRSLEETVRSRDFIGMDGVGFTAEPRAIADGSGSEANPGSRESSGSTLGKLGARPEIRRPFVFSRLDAEGGKRLRSRSRPAAEDRRAFDAFALGAGRSSPERTRRLRRRLRIR